MIQLEDGSHFDLTSCLHPTEHTVPRKWPPPRPPKRSIFLNPIAKDSKSRYGQSSPHPSSSASIQWAPCKTLFDIFGNVIPPKSSPVKNQQQAASKWVPPEFPRVAARVLPPPLRPTRPDKSSIFGTFISLNAPKAETKPPAEHQRTAHPPKRILDP